MRTPDASTHGTGIAEAIGIVSGLKGSLVWLGGSLAGLTAILYVCGYLITTAHTYMLGLHGLVDFGKDYFLLEGAKFVLAVVIGVAQVIIGPGPILAMALVTPLALAVILAKGPLIRAWNRLKEWYEPRSNVAWMTALRFSLYCVLLITCSVIAFRSLSAISFHLQISDLLYSAVDDATCKREAIGVRDALLCGRFAEPQLAFNRQLWSVITLMVLSSIAWHLVSKWRWRAWLIGPLVFVTGLLFLMLPMEFGVLLKPTRYPLVLVQTEASAGHGPTRGLFLIDRSDKGLTAWDPATRRVLWIPVGDVTRMDTLRVNELFGPARK